MAPPLSLVTATIQLIPEWLRAALFIALEEYVRLILYRQILVWTTPSFRWNHLPTPTSFRLVRNLRVADGKLQCLLDVFEIDKAPDYCALSYTCGDPRAHTLHETAANWDTQPSSLLCDGKKMVIRQSLSQALNHVCKVGLPSDNKYLWVDAICINQNDLAERSTQVGTVMDQIYKRASHIVAWLGESDQYTEKALRWVEYFAQRPEGEKEYYPPHLQSSMPLSEADWTAVAAFMHRPYWRRAWCVQEMLLARHIVMWCGKHAVSWDSLLRCSAFLSQTKLSEKVQLVAHSHFTPVMPQGNLGNVMNALQVLKQSLGRADMNQALLLGRTYEATDPRDLVYAYLGLAKEHVRLTPQGPEAIRRSLDRLPVPDYTKSVEQVYIDRMVYLLDVTQNLSMLAEVGGGMQISKDRPRLPSWVTDLRSPLPSSLLFAAATPCRWSPLRNIADADRRGVVAENGMLHVQGLLFDVVTATSSEPFFNGMRPNFEVVPLLEFFAPYLNRAYPGKQSSYAQALWRTLIANQERSPGWHHKGSDAITHPADMAMSRAFNVWLASRFETLGNIIKASNFALALARTSLVNRSIPQYAMEEDIAFQQLQKIKTAGRQILPQVVADALFDGGSRDAAEQHLAEIETARLKLIQQLHKFGSEDKSGTFFRPEQVQSTIGVLEGVKTQEQLALLAEKDRFHTNLMNIAGHRRIFATRKGYFGITAASVHKGDEVWLLKGGFTPFVLRRKGADAFQLVGEAYVHGIMHGEAVAEGSVELKEIRLC